MKLTKIEIEQFGGLKNYSLTFTGGPLYIYGENEAGKSTICAFIAAMFYGLAGKVRNGGLKGDSRNLYMPWGETYMAGTVYFTAEGRDYVLNVALAGRQRETEFLYFLLRIGRKLPLIRMNWDKDF